MPNALSSNTHSESLPGSFRLETKSPSASGGTEAATQGSVPLLPDELEEERRLAYVGITRAQEVLYISRSAHRVLRGKPVPRTLSRFIQEIPAELLEERDIAGELEAPVQADELAAFFSGFASDFAGRE